MSDLEGRCFVKKGLSLVPADEAAGELLSGLKDGKEIIVSIRRPRNPSHHRWFFQLLRKVVENSDDWNDEDELLDAIKIAVGHTEIRMRLDGTQYRRPKSISFASMGEDEFGRFKARALYILGQSLGYDPETLMREVDDAQRQRERVPA